MRIAKKEIFASTNAVIAMEMIPLGNQFINLFCRNHHNDFIKFERIFIPQSNSERKLLNAFRYYHQIIRLKDPREKNELLLLASLTQLESEQIRIDHLIDTVFWIGTKSRLVKYVFRKIATKKGSLRIGNDEIIQLTKKN